MGKKKAIKPLETVVEVKKPLKLFTVPELGVSVEAESATHAISKAKKVKE